MPRLCQPRDQGSRLGGSEVQSSTAMQNPAALVGHLFSRPMTAVCGPAVVFVEPLRDARENKCQGMASWVPHVWVEKAHVSILIHVVVVRRPERRVRYQYLGHLVGIIWEVDRHEVRLANGRLHRGLDVYPAVARRVSFNKCELQRGGSDFSPDALNIRRHTSSLTFPVLAAQV